jgi:hypothetical protein
MKGLLESIGAPNFVARHWGKLLLAQATALIGLGFVLASLMGGSDKPAPVSPASAAKTKQAEEGPSM